MHTERISEVDNTIIWSGYSLATKDEAIYAHGNKGTLKDVYDP